MIDYACRYTMKASVLPDASSKHAQIDTALPLGCAKQMVIDLQIFQRREPEATGSVREDSLAGRLVLLEPVCSSRGPGVLKSSSISQ